MRGLKKFFLTLLLVLPFVLGMIGFILAGENLPDAMYGALNLYVINTYLDEKNICIELARWLAPLASVSGLMLVIKGAWQRVKEFFRGLRKDSVTVYCDDEETGMVLLKQLKHGILSTDGRLRRTPEQILLFKNDMDNLNFYRRNKEFFDKKRVYMKLEKVDSFLLKKNSVRFFDLEELVARQYWLTHSLQEHCRDNSLYMKIAIVGFDSMGQKILNYGRLNNIYALNQCIEYHVWGESSLYQSSYDDTQMQNADRIIFHGGAWQEDMDKLVQMDRIIITERDNLRLLQELLYVCNDKEIHYYCEGEALLENVFGAEGLKSFGQRAKVLTVNNIKGDETYRFAKQINYQYYCLYGGEPVDQKNREKRMEELWEELDGFTKGSNIAAADYHEIRRRMLLKAAGEKYDMEALSELEHIRWCRYHYLNHWKYGVPENGKSKDVYRKIHKCLVPYAELSQEDKEKDTETVELLLALKGV